MHNTRKYFAILLPVVFTFFGCGQSTNSISNSTNSISLTPEELGYYQEFNKLLKVTNRESYLLERHKSLVELNSKVNKLEEAEENEEELLEAYRSLKEISRDNSSHLSKVLPPSSMQNVHLEWLRLLKEIEASSHPQDLASENIDFQKAFSLFSDEFDERAKVYPNDNDNDLKVVFSPILASNVAVNLATFEVSISASLPTPIGKFKVTRSIENDNEVSKLVVTYRDRFRYLSLASGYKVYIPSTCGIWIEQGNKALMLEVSDCESQTATQPQPFEFDTEESNQSDSSPINPLKDKIVLEDSQPSIYKGGGHTITIFVDGKKASYKGCTDKDRCVEIDRVSNSQPGFYVWEDEKYKYQMFTRTKNKALFTIFDKNGNKQKELYVNRAS